MGRLFARPSGSGPAAPPGLHNLHTGNHLLRPNA